MKRAALTLLVPGLLALSGCAADDDAAMGDLAGPPTPPSSTQPVIEEPDLYKLVGTTLYVQNPTTGFNVVSVATAKQPKLLGTAPNSAGAGAEMYIRGAAALVLLKSASGSCKVPQGIDLLGWSVGSELLMLDHTTKTNPKVVERYCLPGNLVASRTVDNILYLVQAHPSESNSQALSLDVTDPHQVKVVQQLHFADATSKEIKVTAEAIFVASGVPQSYPPTSLISYISIDKTGKMTHRGAIEVEGTPQGRFHMNVTEDQFRIVTYNASARQTMLYVIDITDPDNLTELGKLTDIGRWEQLYATRFDGDLAYVVTYRQSDPLWVVSLKNPAQPEVVGELQVPGWSDFIFPRGKTLITVGRGDNGGSLGLSLFDVSDPTSPRAIDQISLGDPSTQSEANVDHRAVTILERPGQNPIVVVPHTVVDWRGDCRLVDRVQLVEVGSDRLTPRGSVEQYGTTRRTLLVDPALYSISDQEVLAIDIDNLDQPRVDSRLQLAPATGTRAGAAQYCNDWGGYYRDDVYEDGQGYPLMWNCSVQPGSGVALPPVTVVLGLLWLGAWWRRRC